MGERERERGGSASSDVFLQFFGTPHPDPLPYFIADNVPLTKDVIGGDEARERGQQWR